MFTTPLKINIISVKSDKCDALFDLYSDLGMLFGNDGVEDYIDNINRRGLKIVNGFKKQI